MYKDYNYLAGIIDGEGSVCLTKNNTGSFRYPTITVATTTKEIVNYLKSNFKGKITRKLTKQKESHKDSYVWSSSGNACLDILKNVVELLIEPRKKNRALYILSRYKGVTPRNGKYTKLQLEKKEEFEKVFFLI